MEDDPLRVYHRKSVAFKDFERFKLSSKNFQRQFSGIYTARLAALNDDVRQKAKAKWASYEVLKLSELAENDENQRSIVIGTLYKHQELKPSILRELSEELQVTPQAARSNYASFKDALFLEDETLRVKLVGNHVNTQDVVTGIVCAVLGYTLENGTFFVLDWCFPSFNSQHVICNTRTEKGEKILLISGLDLANNVQPLSLNLLSEWINGLIADNDSQKEAASVVYVVIAGNSIRGSVETHNYKSYFQNKAHDEVIFKETATVARKFDAFLDAVAQSCSVILMPGEFDPVCHTIPQQPFHPCILPQSSRFKSLHAVTNPWIGSIDTRIIAGSSGQPITDIMKVAGLADASPLTWLERTLNWRHFAPTAPDTLPAFPYFESDPFVMMERPDIYFVGNTDEYDTKLTKEDGGQAVRLICVPKFSQTQTAVLVDLQDLRTLPISFGVG